MYILSLFLIRILCPRSVSYTHLRAHETPEHLVCRLLLEKISLKEKRDDYSGLQERIDKLKEKYRLLRDQKIKERVEALGVKLQGDEDRETLLEKEKEYTLARQKVEFALESFYRSASSLAVSYTHLTLPTNREV